MKFLQMGRRNVFRVKRWNSRRQIVVYHRRRHSRRQIIMSTTTTDSSTHTLSNNRVSHSPTDVTFRCSRLSWVIEPSPSAQSSVFHPVKVEIVQKIQKAGACTL